MAYSYSFSHRCVFLDRDGVLNREIGDYILRQEQLEISPIADELKALKEGGFLLIVATNQGGIDKGLYTRQWVLDIHEQMQKAFSGVLDGLYYSPHHPVFSRSYLSKPDSMMFEKAIARFGIDPAVSWMIGDKERDLTPAKSLGMKCILLDAMPCPDSVADYVCFSFGQAAQVILEQSALLPQT